MRTSSLKALAVSTAALLFGGALAATPALAADPHPGNFGGGGAIWQPGPSSPGPSPSFNGPSPSFNGSFSHGNPGPSGNFKPWGSAPPNTGYVPPGGPHRPNFVPQGGLKGHHPYRGGRYRRVRVGGAWVTEWCDDYYDYYCDNGYYYNDSACWVLRRVYNKHGKFIRWRRVYICQ